jgi:hypothetical protein
VNGLRVYIRDVVARPDSRIAAFYSRKGGGPFYQWLYDDQQAVWRCSRLNCSPLTPRAFCVASWKSLPTSLRARLSEHYIE